jgi:hypothetical protein
LNNNCKPVPWIAIGNGPFWSRTNLNTETCRFCYFLLQVILFMDQDQADVAKHLSLASSLKNGCYQIYNYNWKYIFDLRTDGNPKRSVNPTAVNFEIVNKILQECETHLHSVEAGNDARCNKRHNLSLWLLDVEELCLVRVDHNTPKRYAALSYVWYVKLM